MKRFLLVCHRVMTYTDVNTCMLNRKLFFWWEKGFITRANDFFNLSWPGKQWLLSNRVVAYSSMITTNIVNREERWFGHFCEKETIIPEPRWGSKSSPVTILQCCDCSHSPTLCEQYSWPLINGHHNLHINNYETGLVAHCKALVLVLVII